MNRKGRRDRERRLAQRQVQARKYKDYYTTLQTKAFITLSQRVTECKVIISTVNAGDLMSRCYWGLLAARLDAPPEESLAGTDSVRASFMVTYVHKLIAGCGTPDPLAPNISDQQFDELFEHTFEILRSLSFVSKDKNTPNLTRRERMLAVQLQIFWSTVSGDRYTFFEVDHLRALVTPHNDALLENFGVTAEQIVIGVGKLQKSLTRGPIAAMESLHAAWDDWRKGSHNEKSELSPESVCDATTRGKNPFSSDFFDVQRITEWPTKFIEALSLRPGEDHRFCKKGSDSGWPTRASLTSIKPFLRLGERSFIYFHHHILDGFYASLRTALLTASPAYADEWNIRQASMAEREGIKLFEKLLLGSSIRRKVFYQFTHKDTKALEWAECDAVCEFDQRLFVIEVKAGAYTPQPPSKAFRPHLQSINELLIAPIEQGFRLTDELKAKGKLDLFDQRCGNTIGQLNYSNLDDICVVAITLEQLTEIAPKVENILQARKQTGAGALWAVSIDDLRVFAEILTNPLVFLHYLSIRREAYTFAALDTDDELDHLGAYFSHNQYVELLRQRSGKKMDTVVLNGYRDEFDRYFHARLLGELPPKPSQVFPKLLAETLEMLAKSQSVLKIRVAFVLLNLSEALRQQLFKGIENSREKQALVGRPLPVNVVGTHPLTIYVDSYDVAATQAEKRVYTHALMRSRGEEERLTLTLRFVQGKLWGLQIDKHCVKDTSDLNSEDVRRALNSIQKIRWTSALGK